VSTRERMKVALQERIERDVRTDVMPSDVDSDALSDMVVAAIAAAKRTGFSTESVESRCGAG
jgi:hypothetical protein